MKNYHRLATAVGLLFLTGCQTTPAPVNVTPTAGPIAAKLDDTLSKQLADLRNEIALMSQKNVELQKVGAQAAGSVQGIQIAAVHIEEPNDALAKEAIIDEAKLAEQALKAAENAPPEVVAAYAKAALSAEQRVNYVLTGQRDKARLAYADASKEVDTQRLVVSAKDKEITAQVTLINTRDQTIVQLKKDAQNERDTNAKTIANALKERDDKIQKILDEQAAKERRLWINTLRFGGIGFVGVGVVAIALSQGTLWVQGGLMILGGALTIAFGMFLDILTAQPWFKYALGVVVLVAVSAGLWWLYEVWKSHRLNDKLMGAVQDMKDESKIKGGALWDEAREHLTYRLGDAGSFWSKVIQKKLAQRGLINKIEKPSDTPTPPVEPQLPPTSHAA